MDDAFRSADLFLLRNARLLERRLFATCFLHAPGSGVVDALRGYQNDDGGFGHALEPDTRCPVSLPIYVECAFQAMATATAADPGVVARACDYLSRSSGGSGAVPLAAPVIESFPRADHWSDWTYLPGLNPTAGLVGLLYELGIDHPWRESAAAWCWAELDAGRLPADAHAASEVFQFLAHAPEAERADRQAHDLAKSLASLSMFHLDPDQPGYGLTPLHIAPSPTARWRRLFSDAQIDGHLDALGQGQFSDGGWAIGWEPPSETARWEWRGIETLRALRVLTAYGRLAPTD